jgi:hypothetical protein
LLVNSRALLEYWRLEYPRRFLLDKKVTFRIVAKSGNIRSKKPPLSKETFTNQNLFATFAAVGEQCRTIARENEQLLNHRWDSVSAEITKA